MNQQESANSNTVSREFTCDHTNTMFSSVRFGNVFRTRGSILPRIENQIKNGGPITLTDLRMKRFFMTKTDAVNLIITATELVKGGETFVLKMPLVSLNDLFDSMKEVLSKKYDYISSQIKTKIMGIRPGEKLVEYLLTRFEIENVLETKNFFIIPPLNSTIKNSHYPNAKKPKNLQSYFENMKPLSKKEIISILKKSLGDCKYTSPN